MSITSKYDEQADFFDDMMPSLTAESPEIEVYADALSSAKTILEFGSGTGRITYPLAELLSQRNGRVRVDALDLSERMIEVAHAKADSTPHQVELKFSVADACGNIRTIFPNFGTYNAAFALCGFTSLLGFDGLPAFFTNVFDSLTPGGILLVDGLDPKMVNLSIPFINGTFMPTEERRGLITFAEVEGDKYLADFIWVDGNVAKRFSESCTLIAPNELDSMATKAGLRVDGKCSDILTARVREFVGPTTFLRVYYR